MAGIDQRSWAETGSQPRWSDVMFDLTSRPRSIDSLHVSRTHRGSVAHIHMTRQRVHNLQLRQPGRLPSLNGE